MIKALIFDLDDTLVPSTEGYRQILGELFGKEQSAYVAARGKVKRTLPAGSPSARNRLLYFKAMLEAENKFFAARVMTLMDDYEKKLGAYMLKFDRGAWLASLARKYKLAVLTNENLRTQLLKLRAVDPEGRLTLLTSEEVGVEKPHPRIFKEVLARLGLKAEEAAFVGDDLEADIAPALQMGFAKVFFTTEYRAPAECPAGAISISTLSEIEKHL